MNLLHQMLKHLKIVLTFNKSLTSFSLIVSNSFKPQSIQWEWKLVFSFNSCFVLVIFCKLWTFNTIKIHVRFLNVRFSFFCPINSFEYIKHFHDLNWKFSIVSFMHLFFFNTLFTKRNSSWLIYMSWLDL